MSGSLSFLYIIFHLRGRETENSHQLVHSPNAHNGQGWVRLKTGTRKSNHVFHKSGRYMTIYSVTWFPTSGLTSWTSMTSHLASTCRPEIMILITCYDWVQQWIRPFDHTVWAPCSVIGRPFFKGSSNRKSCGIFLMSWTGLAPRGTLRNSLGEIWRHRKLNQEKKTVVF